MQQVGKRILVGVILAAILIAPRPVDAGIRHGLKRAAVKVGHVMENAIYVAAAVGALVLVCKGGACG